MERYDYLENIKNDLRSWIEENFDNIPKGDTTAACPPVKRLKFPLILK